LPRHKSELLTSITKIIKFLSFLLLGVTAIVVATLCIKITIYNGDPSVFDTPEALSLASPATWGRIILTAGTSISCSNSYLTVATRSRSSISTG
jgi:hypothetical protein